MANTLPPSEFNLNILPPLAFNGNTLPPPEFNLNPLPLVSTSNLRNFVLKKDRAMVTVQECGSYFQSQTEIMDI
jgi:hypothetical protein